MLHYKKTTKNTIKYNMADTPANSDCNQDSVLVLSIPSIEYPHCTTFTISYSNVAIDF